MRANSLLPRLEIKLLFSISVRLPAFTSPKFNFIFSDNEHFSHNALLGNARFCDAIPVWLGVQYPE